jgi:hypothetical protein
VRAGRSQRALLITAGLVAGCSFSSRTQGAADAPDDTTDVPDVIEQVCLGPAGNFQICVPAPTAPFNVLTPSSLDTNFAGSCVLVAPASGPVVCVKAATTILISSNVTITGDLPIVFFATQSISVSGLIDVSSRLGIRRGPGANPTGATDCAAPMQNAGADDGGAGGGAGGSFGTIGGNGGEGAGTLMTAGAPGAAAAAPAYLRGGCTGGAGGAGSPPSAAVTGSDGGGAIYLVSGGSIAITGTINASGAGGAAGLSTDGGAGGGGSGGMIAMFATTTLTDSPLARIYANGGGGGEGGDLTGVCDPGNESTTPGTAAAGGRNSCPMGGDGGNGAVGTNVGANGSGARGGGGGGGGVGVIRILSTHSLPNAQLSPDPS